MEDSIGDKELGRIEAPASMDHWERFIDFATEHIHRAIADESRAYKLKLAYEELISNIIRASVTNQSSNKNMASLAVTSIMRDEGGEPWLVFRTSDTGIRFNPDFKQRDPIDTNQPINERQLGGLGFFLIEQSVDKVSYDWINGNNVYELCMACSRVAAQP
jgi:anti-sigma regulatory factor (Ser/Thr protein kinase)